MMVIDLDACAYGHSDETVPDIDFLYSIRGDIISFSSPLRPEEDRELNFQYQQCAPYYAEFAQDPGLFLRDYAYVCHAGRSNGSYALSVETPEGRLVRFFLNPQGQVFVTCPDRAEGETAFSGEGRKRIAASGKTLDGFKRFLAKHTKDYALLYDGAVKKYEALVLEAGQEKTGRHGAFLVDFNAGAFTDTDPAGPRGNFMRGANGRSVVSLLPQSLNNEVAFQFGCCFVTWLEFIKNAAQFLKKTTPRCLFDPQSGQYALLITNSFIVRNQRQYSSFYKNAQIKYKHLTGRSLQGLKIDAGRRGKLK